MTNPTNHARLSADEPPHDDQDTEPVFPLPRRTYGLNVWVTLVDPAGIKYTEVQRNSILYRVFRSHGWKEVKS